MDENDELKSEQQKLKQKFIGAQRKSQRIRAKQRRSNHSRKPSKDLIKSTDITQPPANSAPRSNQPHKPSTDLKNNNNNIPQPHKSSKDSTDNNIQPSPTFSEEEEDFRSGNEEDPRSGKCFASSYFIVVAIVRNF